MEKQKITIEKSFSVDGISIIPIARILHSEMRRGNFIHIYAKKEPVAVIFLRGASRNIYNEEGKEISVEDLLNDFPEAKELIGEIINKF